MIFDCGETVSEYEERMGEWHNWFAWYPIRMAPHRCAWLQTVERRGVLKSSFYEQWIQWEYRPRGPQP